MTILRRDPDECERVRFAAAASLLLAPVRLGGA